MNMNWTIAIIILVVLVVGGWYYYQSAQNTVPAPPATSEENALRPTAPPTEPDDDQTTAREIAVPVSSEGPFKYFQFNIKTGSGLKGAILVNGQTLRNFDADGLQGSYNQAQSLIQDGENTVELVLESVAADAKPRSGSTNDSLITIALNAMQEPDFPNEQNRILLIEWRPADGNHLLYRFSVRRDSAAPKA